MKALLATAAGFSHWIDSVAWGLASLLDSFSPPRLIRLVEVETGKFVRRMEPLAPFASSADERVRILENSLIDVPASLAAALPGSRVELVLQSARFLFRPLELPTRAGEFLDGIARAQIDRLTPWSAADAAFGWSSPTQISSDRITVTVAATALASLTPYVQAIAAAGAHSIAAITILQQPGAAPAPIKVLEERPRAVVEIGRIRRVLIIILGAAGIAASAAIAGSAVVGASLEAQQGELSRRIVNARAAASTPDEAEFGSVSAAQRRLEMRKYQAPPSVLVLESLSQILPDHTYVTELRIEANKLRLTGVTGDAPSLIGLLERSARFSRATFFAPTTRSPTEQGERFHIESQINPLVTPRP